MTKQFLILLFTIFQLTTMFGQQFEFGTGVIDDIAAEDNIPVKIRVKGKNIRSVASVKEYCPEPGNQGNDMSCAGWAIGYAYMTISEAIAQKTKTAKPIKEVTFSPTFAYDQINGPLGKLCSVGVVVPKILEFYKEKGNLFYKDYGARCGNYVPPNNEVLAMAAKNRIHNYSKLWDRRGVNAPKDKAQRVKEILSENRPVVIIMKTYQSFSNQNFQKLDNGGQLWVNRGVSNYVSAHAMVVVGYDDKYKAFEIMNSYGTGFGNNGFIWIKYKDFQKYCNQAYDITYRDPLTQYEAAQVEESSKTQSNKGIELNKDWEVSANFLKIGKRRGSYYKERIGAKYQKEDYCYMTNQTYQSGKSVFQIEVSTQRQQYFYVFSLDEHNKSELQFPVPDRYKEINGVAKKGEVITLTDMEEEVFILPHSKLGIQLTPNPGIEYYFLLFSLEELDVNKIRVALENSQGYIPNRLKSVLGEKLINSSAIQYYSQDIGFRIVGNIKNKTVVPLIMGIQHK